MGCKLHGYNSNSQNIIISIQKCLFWHFLQNLLLQIMQDQFFLTQVMTELKKRLMTELKTRYFMSKHIFYQQARMSFKKAIIVFCNLYFFFEVLLKFLAWSGIVLQGSRERLLLTLNNSNTEFQKGYAARACVQYCFKSRTETVGS